MNLNVSDFSGLSNRNGAECRLQNAAQVTSNSAAITATEIESKETVSGRRRWSVRICFKDGLEGRSWPALGVMPGENLVYSRESGVLGPLKVI